MPIQIPGYESVLGNQVYKELPVSGENIAFLCLQRVREIAEAQVLEFIKNAMFAYELGQCNMEELRAILGKLPQEIRHGFINGEKDLTSLVASFVPAPRKNGKRRKTFLRLDYGILNEDFIMANIEDSSKYGVLWYVEAFDDQDLIEEGLGGKGYVQLLFMDNRLPSRAKIRAFLADHVTKSDPLEIETTKFSIVGVRQKMIEPVYELTVEELYQIPDTTRFEIMGQALFALGVLYAHLVNEEVIPDMDEAEVV